MQLGEVFYKMQNGLFRSANTDELSFGEQQTACRDETAITPLQTAFRLFILSTHGLVHK